MPVDTPHEASMDLKRQLNQHTGCGQTSRQPETTDQPTRMTRSCLNRKVVDAVQTVPAQDTVCVSRSGRGSESRDPYAIKANMTHTSSGLLAV